MSPVRLVIFDCDSTLWQHPDVSELQPPFRRLDAQTVEDARGERVRLTAGAREALEALRARGLLISVASWNRPEPVLAILEQFGLREYLTRPKVEFHPNKDQMVAALLAELAADGIALRPEEVLFVDDNPDLLRRVRTLGPIRLLQAGVDVTDLRQVLEHLE